MRLKMSKMKRYAEQVSVEMGYDGEINNEVLAEAQKRLFAKEEDHAYQCTVASEINKLITDPFEDKCVNYRMDGRVELVCFHGVGHTSMNLTLLRKGHLNQHDGIHGCDGCCSHPSFHKLETKLSGEQQQQ